VQHVSEQVCRQPAKAETGAYGCGPRRTLSGRPPPRPCGRRAELGCGPAARTGPQRKAVTGYYLAFSSDEMPLQFGRGGPEARRIGLDNQAQARSETPAWLGQNSAP
jgi:hypothetical protein